MFCAASYFYRGYHHPVVEREPVKCNGNQPYYSDAAKGVKIVFFLFSSSQVKCLYKTQGSE